jgi:hypothetical protein
MKIMMGGVIQDDLNVGPGTLDVQYNADNDAVVADT